MFLSGRVHYFLFFFFFFNDTATTEIYTLSLHDALPILSLPGPAARRCDDRPAACAADGGRGNRPHRAVRSERLGDRKSTRLNSSHSQISYAVFCLKKKKNTSEAGSGRCVASDGL